jgi:hypothetical protein
VEPPEEVTIDHSVLLVLPVRMENMPWCYHLIAPAFPALQSQSIAIGLMIFILGNVLIVVAAAALQQELQDALEERLAALLQLRSISVFTRNKSEV